MVATIDFKPAVQACTACELRKHCHRPVPGKGPETARVMIVGETPGRGEDILGQPWKGEAGKILDQLLDYIGLDRSEVYLTNVVKCRPRAGFELTEEHVIFCGERWLEQEIAAVQPEVIVPVGLTATRYFLPEAKNLESVERVAHVWRER